MHDESVLDNRSRIAGFLDAVSSLFDDDEPVVRETHAASRPWPQPSPWFPDAMLPAVLHVPDDDRALWHEHVRGRYRKQLVEETPGAVLGALEHPGLAIVSDARFVTLFEDGPVARFLCPDLDPPDHALFARVLGSGRFVDATFLKADFRVMSLVASDSESAAAETVVLFARDANGSLTLAAIALGDDVFEPDGTDAYVLAKYFALQSAGVCVTIQMHPRLHFPFDTLNAIARTRLPDGHTLKELLRPHLPLELAVADAVLHSTRSVLVPGHIYSPYPTTQEEALRLVQTIWTGHRHRDGSTNRAHPPFTYPIVPPTVHAPYAVFLDRYHDAVRTFVVAVLATIDDDDADTEDLARHAAHFLPGFPRWNGGRGRAEFTDAIATMVFTVSIAHTTDHHLYGQVDPREMPFRLRAERPRPGSTVHFDRGELVDADDLISYALCSKLYFEAHPIAKLVEVAYDFRDESLRRLGVGFVDSLHEVEASLRRDGIRIYLGLDAMASSVQF